MNSLDKVKILYITTNLEIGGAEKMLYSLLSKINRSKFEPAIISLMNIGILGDSFKALGIPVYSLGMKPRMPTLPVIWKLIRLVHKFKPNLIQGWMYHGNLAAQLVKLFNMQKIDVLWSIHHSINSLTSEKKMTQSIIKFGAFLSQFNEQTVFVSKKSKLQHDALGYCSKRSCVIPNGFDTSLFKPSLGARYRLRKEIGLPEDTFLIGSFGRDHPMKDHLNFLKAAAILLKKFSDVHFVLAGTGIDLNNQSINELVQDLGIAHRIHLLGERNDIPYITPALDIYTSSSAYGEAFPLVVGEAMSCGVPCVVTDVGDSAWIVGNTGIVVPPKNSEALANAWKELIMLDPQDRQALGKAARSKIIKSFSLYSVIAQYETLYEKVLAEKLN
ncbi:glycoside hydrolase [Calothrix sp. HK-06]|nr:glycoside hydrolase [Calothrix sp. HK-06]